MEHLGQVPREHLQRLVRARGQVVHAHVLVLAARRYHVPADREAHGDVLTALKDHYTLFQPAAQHHPHVLHQLMLVHTDL